MVSFRGQKKLGPRPDRSPLGVSFKISDEHPHPFHMRSSQPPREFVSVSIHIHAGTDINATSKLSNMAV